MMDYRGETVFHLHIAPTVLKLLDIPLSQSMKMKPLAF